MYFSALSIGISTAAAIRIDASRPMEEVCRLAVAEVAARLDRNPARA